MFPGSPRWLLSSKKHHSSSVKVSGEAASAGPEDAKAFKEELPRTTADEKYLLEQIFGADETGLLWECVPAHASIHQESEATPSLKALKDSTTVLWGRNVAEF